MMDWMNSPLLSDMDPVKLELIKAAAEQTSGKSGNSLAPVLMTLITSANRKGIRFTTDEINIILQCLKHGKSPQEQGQIDKTVQMVSSVLTQKGRH